MLNVLQDLRKVIVRNAQSKDGREHVESWKLLQDEVVGQKHLMLKDLDVPIDNLLDEVMALI